MVKGEGLGIGVDALLFFDGHFTLVSVTVDNRAGTLLLFNLVDWSTDMYVRVKTRRQ